MKKALLAIFLFIILVPSLVFAQSEKKKALYFYADGCSLCNEVDSFFSSQSFYEKYAIEKINVSGPYNMKYLNAFFDVFGVNQDKRGWPAVVFDTEMLIGSQQIMDKFSPDMEKYGQVGTPIPLEIKKKLEQKENEANASNEIMKKKISASFILSAALIDSVNPCSLAVVVILLGLLLFTRREKRVFSIGLFFVFGVFLAYFLIGLVSLNLSWNVLVFSKPISITIGAVAILVGLFNVRYLLNLKKFSLNTSLAFFEKKADLFFKKIISPISSLAMGFFSFLFLIPCASRPYLTTMRALALRGPSGKNIFFLTFYNIIFILPLAAVIVIVYFGVRNKKVRAWRNRWSLLARTKLIHVIIGAVMVFAGVYLIQNWI